MRELDLLALQELELRVAVLLQLLHAPGLQVLQSHVHVLAPVVAHDAPVGDRADAPLVADEVALAEVESVDLHGGSGGSGPIGAKSIRSAVARVSGGVRPGRARGRATARPASPRARRGSRPRT